MIWVNILCTKHVFNAYIHKKNHNFFKNINVMQGNFLLEITTITSSKQTCLILKLFSLFTQSTKVKTRPNIKIKNPWKLQTSTKTQRSFLVHFIHPSAFNLQRWKTSQTFFRGMQSLNNQWTSTSILININKNLKIFKSHHH